MPRLLLGGGHGDRPLLVHPHAQYLSRGWLLRRVSAPPCSPNESDRMAARIATQRTQRRLQRAITRCKMLRLALQRLATSSSPKTLVPAHMVLPRLMLPVTSRSACFPAPRLPSMAPSRSKAAVL